MRRLFSAHMGLFAAFLMAMPAPASMAVKTGPMKAAMISGSMSLRSGRESASETGRGSSLAAKAWTCGSKRPISQPVFTSTHKAR